jgi:hypothetical protein
MIRAALLLSPLLLAACNVSGGDGEGNEVAPTGSGGSRDYAVEGFNAVSLGGNDDVVVTVGPAASVRAIGDPEELDRLDVRLDGTQLRIGRKRDVALGLGQDRAAVTVHVSVPALANAAIGGSGNMRIDGVTGSRFEASIAGSGGMQIGRINVDEGRFSIAGSGGITAGGRAGSVHIDIAGSGDADLSALASRTARIAIVGSGDAHVQASESADVNVLGSGDVSVAGGATCAVRRHGSGEVRCGE